MTTAVASIVGPSSFRALQQDGRRFRSGAVRLIFRPHDDAPRVAFALGRGFGPAVHRNRARRRLREAFRAVVPEMPTGDYLFVCPPNVLNITFREIETSLKAIATQILDLDETSRVSGDRLSV